MSGAPIRWEPEDDALLKKYADALMSAQKIAAQLVEETGKNRTRNSVIGRCWRKGIKLHGVAADASRGTAAARRIERQKQKEERDRLKKQEQASKKAKTVVKGETTASSSSPVKKEKPRSPSDVPLDETKFVVIHELTSRTCRFPVRNITASSFLYCGLLPEGNSSYCKEHATVCFQPPARPKK